MASSVLLLGTDRSGSASVQNRKLLNGTPIIITTPASLNSKLKQGVLRQELLLFFDFAVKNTKTKHLTVL